MLEGKEQPERRIHFAARRDEKNRRFVSLPVLRKKLPEVHYDFKAGSGHATREPAKTPRIGVYAGSFDPVHTGHIIFALKSQKLAGLDHIYFMPERRPQRNTEPEHYVHRAVMLTRALKPHHQFSVLDLPDAHLSIRSLPRIREKAAAGAEICLLTTAADLLWHDGPLPKLYQQNHLVVAIVSHSQLAEVLERVHGTGEHFGSISFVDIGKDHISSAAVRTALRRNMPVRGLLPSVMRYARTQWLYIRPHKS